MNRRNGLCWPLVVVGAVVTLCASTHLLANSARARSQRPAVNDRQRLRIYRQIQLMADADTAVYGHNRAKAESILKEAISLGGNPDLERLHLVRLYEDEGRPKDVLAQYRLVLHDPDGRDGADASQGLGRLRDPCREIRNAR